MVNALARTSDDGSLLAGRYELIAELASGGMATVYLARAWNEDGFERWCAIKKLHPHLAREREYIEMFIDEARLAGRIHHPNVIETLAAGRDDDGSHFLVMQYVAGQHLGALLRSVTLARRRIPPPLVLRIMLDALAGLSAAHALRGDDGLPLGLVHRDISPHNILVGAEGLARLTDFGIAKASGRLHATRSNVVKGKLAYMSPEQLSGKAVDQRADVFAMGVVLWEALTHRRLLASDDPAEIFRRVLHDPIPAPSSVRRELQPLDAVLAKALRRDPNERYASATEIARAVERAAPAVGGLASPRAVARLVEVVAKDKLDAERLHVANAAPRPLTSAAVGGPRSSQTHTRELGPKRRPAHGREGPRVVTPAAPQRSSLLSAALGLLCGSFVALIPSDRATSDRDLARFAQADRVGLRRTPRPISPPATTSVGAIPTTESAETPDDVSPPRRARHRDRARPPRASVLEPPSAELHAPPNPYLPEAP